MTCRVPTFHGVVARQGHQEGCYPLDRVLLTTLDDARAAKLKFSFDRLVKLLLRTRIACNGASQLVPRYTANLALADGACVAGLGLQESKPHIVAGKGKIDNGPLIIPARLVKTDGARLHAVDASSAIAFAEENLFRSEVATSASRLFDLTSRRRFGILISR